MLSNRRGGRDPRLLLLHQLQSSYPLDDRPASSLLAAEAVDVADALENRRTPLGSKIERHIRKVFNNLRNAMMNAFVACTAVRRASQKTCTL